MKSVQGNKAGLKPFELMLDQKKISQRVMQLGERISSDYTGESLVLVGVLKGCIVFMADLMRHIKLPVEIEFISAASYRHGIRREDDVVIGGGVAIPLKRRHVLVVEGIVDTGRTASVIVEKIRKMEPASVEVVTLLDKPASHRAKIDIKYKGFTIGNEFVIGFGLDNAQLYRNLPFIGKMIEG
ncbi:MAG: hypoxanthine phosphoribosyltransferase [candidate division Zixibacteria bacterium]|nr:hypoxanthine phosphoribosyltransferase [candidate division Zixibacteria bacterium]